VEFASEYVPTIKPDCGDIGKQNFWLILSFIKLTSVKLKEVRSNLLLARL
jgi:hypothetical protein